jgi:cysteinyl-tRNA synthetase
MHNAWVTAAGEKMSKSLGNGALVSEVTKRYPPRAVRFYLAQPHYRSAIEFSDDSLDEATAALARIDSFVERALEATGERGIPTVPQPFIEALNDDLGTPAAVAVLYGAVRDGNSALDAGALDQVARRLGEVTGMLDVLGLDASAEIWATTNDDSQLSAVVDGLIAELLKQRSAARDRKDYAAADAVRGSLSELGVEIADTPRGPRWSLTHRTPQEA